MKRAFVLFSFLVLGGMGRLEAHAFLHRAEPGVGSTVPRSPNEVKIQFTEAVEPALSKIQVFAASGKEVDKGDVHVDSSDQALLKVSLPPLGSGTYRVAWRVVSVDTHVTSGTFTFHVGG
jgi:copper resistance protein C